MNYLEEMQQRIAYLRSLQATLQGAPGAAGAHRLTVSAEQLATLTNLVFSDIWESERDLKRHLQMTEVVRRLKAGESVADVKLPR